MQTNQSHLELELLSALIDGEVSEAEARAAEEHLAVCAACRAERDQLQRTVHMVRALPQVRPPRSFQLPATLPDRSAAPARLPRRRALVPPWSWPSPRTLRALSGVAAALMVVLFAADFFTMARSAAVGPAVAPPAERGQASPPPAVLRGAEETVPAPPAALRAAPARDRVPADVPPTPIQATEEPASLPAGAAGPPDAAGGPAGLPLGAPRVVPRAAHLGAGFGALAVLLIAASAIAARRRPRPATER